MSAYDPGCVKTRKIGESRECFFLHQLKSDMPANICAPKRGLDKRLFYRRHASLSFYTAKTQSEHTAPRLGQVNAAGRPMYRQVNFSSTVVLDCH
jgi:hypothetical protein